MEEKSVNELMDEMEVLQDELAEFQEWTAEDIEKRRGRIHEEEAHLNEELEGMERTKKEVSEQYTVWETVMETRKKEIGEEATALKKELTSFDKLEAKRKELNNKKTELARIREEIEDRASKLLDGQVGQS